MTDAHAVTARIAGAFRRVHETAMHDLPIVNRRLAVEVLGTQAWRDHWLAVLLTPWCVNLLLLPRDDRPAAAADIVPGASRTFAFPSGRYAFIGADDAVLGRYRACSLLSPVLELENQAAARALGEAALAALMQVDESVAPPAVEAPRHSRRAWLGGGAARSRD